MREYVSDYCTSEHFLFLDPDVKEHAEQLLGYFCEQVGDDCSGERIDQVMAGMARLDIALSVKMALPSLLEGFFSYLDGSGKMPGVARWAEWVAAGAARYRGRFRDDGSVKGTTHTNKAAPTGRNDPCPCGSGKKFKKCCMRLFS